MQPFFKSIQVNNLLSFGPDSPPIELGPLSVIIGTNGSGKSNLFDVLALLKNSLGRFYQFFSEYDCPIGEWQWKSIDPKIETASVQVEGQTNFPFPEKVFSPFTHRLVLDFSSNYRDALNVINNTITIGMESGEWPSLDYTPKLNGDGEKLDIRLTSVRGFPASPLLDNMYMLCTYYEKCVYLYNSWTYGRKSPLRGLQKAHLPDQYLNEDGSNLGVVLKKIRNNEESHARYLEFLKQLYEGVDDFEIDEYKDGTLRVYLREGERIIHAARLSDGTLRYLMLLAVLCDPEPPAVVCIEEPEMGLHPDLVHVMAEALQYAVERTQVIVTTHSVRLVDHFTPTPEVIQVCEKYEGQTYIERLDPEELKPWLENYRLGDLWSRGGIGGNRW